MKVSRIFFNPSTLRLVANFGLVFSLEPRQLARQVLVAAVTVALLPNLAFTLWSLLTCGCCSNTTVAYLVGSSQRQFELNFVTAYLLVWLLLSLVLVLLVLFGIPAYLQRVHTSLAIRD